MPAKSSPNDASTLDAAAGDGIQPERKPKARALFLDRDGVINVDKGYVHTAEEFELVPGIGEVLQHFAAQGFLLIIVTNQAGIARGYYTEEEFLRFDAWVRDHLQERFGVTFAKTYYAPHHPDGVIPRYRRESPDRKPNPGMILTAARELDIDLAASVLIGDKESDIEAGRCAGVGQCYRVSSAQSPFHAIKHVLQSHPDAAAGNK